MKAGKAWVLEQVIAPIVASGLALPHREDDPRYPAMVDLWCEELAHFSPDTLQAGARPFIRQWRKRFKLTLADLLTHFEEIDVARNPRRQALPPPDRRGADDEDKSWDTPEHRQFMAECLAVTREWFASGRLAAKHGLTPDDARKVAGERLARRAETIKA